MPIKTRLIKALLIVIILMTNLAWAQQEENTSLDSCENDNTCIEQSKWQIGIAIGLGAKSNPLIDSDAVPQLVLLDIAWYSENAYFDNGEIGYKFIQTETTGMESYLTIDREALYFDFWHPSNVFVSSPVLTPIDPDLNPDNEPTYEEVDLSLDQLATRKWAVNAGLRSHFYGDNYEWSLSVEGDVSGVHKGYKAALSYQYNWRGNDWGLVIRPSLIWKSDRLVNYYYGLSEQDNIISTQVYKGKGGLQTAISIMYSKQLNENWQWIVSGSYRKLHSGMTNSPLVKSNHVGSLFVGAGYRF